MRTDNGKTLRHHPHIVFFPGFICLYPILSVFDNMPLMFRAVLIK